ncbi:hypothetical protein Tco_0723429 [Tanacetum coccineum]
MLECTAPYDHPHALITTNMLQADQEEAYNTDVMKATNAAVLSWPNLSSTVQPTIQSISDTDTRPPMLVESDYDSWKIRIHRYIRGKPNGKLIWKSIQNGPTPHPMITDPPPTGSTVVPAPRKKLDSEFNEEENKLEMADTQAEIILSQGLPRHIFNILNQTSTTKEIWDNVELLMQGSGRTLQQRKEDLFDEYERFHAIGNESIHDYFEQSESIVDPLAYVAHTISAPALPSPSTSSSQPTAQSSNDALMATMTQIANLLSMLLNRSEESSSNVAKQVLEARSVLYNAGGGEHGARHAKKPKRAKESQYFKDIRCCS